MEVMGREGHVGSALGDAVAEDEDALSGEVVDGAGRGDEGAEEAENGGEEEFHGGVGGSA